MAGTKISSTSKMLVFFYFLHLSLAMDLCDGSDDAQYSGSNIDSSGIYVGTDKVTHPYKFPAIRKCWYDYYITDASLYHTSWSKSSGDTFCSGTSICGVSSMHGTNNCQSRSDTVSISIGVEAATVAPVEIGGTLGVEYSIELTTEACFTNFSTTACQWSDGGCHTVFTSIQMLKQTGYTRKRCNWGQGEETECMADIEIDTPTTLVDYQCGAICGTLPDDMVLAPSSTSTSSLVPKTTTLSASTTTQSASTSTFTVSPTTSSSSSSSLTTSIISSPTNLSIGSAASATSSTTASSISTKHKSTLSGGAKAGVVIGTMAGVAIALLIALFIWNRNRNRNKRTRKDGQADDLHRTSGSQACKDNSEHPPPYDPTH